MPRPQDLRAGHIIGLTRNGVTLRWVVIAACRYYVVAKHAGVLAIMPIRDGRLLDPDGAEVRLEWVRVVDGPVWSGFSVMAAVGVA
jgi:hypothetical protein